MTTKVFVDGNDITELVKNISFTDNRENMVDNATIYIKNITSLPSYVTALAPVKITIDDEAIFYGYIIKMAKNPHPNPNLASWQIDCFSMVDKLKYIYVSESFQNEIASDIVRYLIEKYTDFTTNHVDTW